jgi:hypothetical protein
MQEIVDLICLLYHEARNVRHPINAKKILKEAKYHRLLNLPRKRDQAWEHMATVRERALSLLKVDEIINVFKDEYAISLDELLTLFREPCWKGSLYGGNRWAPICSKIIDLLKSIELEDNVDISILLKKIYQMEHNTGTVEQKLSKLKGFCS